MVATAQTASKASFANSSDRLQKLRQLAEVRKAAQAPASIAVDDDLEVDDDPPEYIEESEVPHAQPPMQLNVPRSSEENEENIGNMLLDSVEALGYELALGDTYTLHLAVQLREHAPGMYERTLRELKKFEDFDKLAWDRAVKGYARCIKSGFGIEAPSDVKLLERIVENMVKLWHSPDGLAWATITCPNVKGQRTGPTHDENYPVASKEFKAWLKGTFLDGNGRVPGRDTFTSILEILDIRAIRGPVHPIHLRTAQAPGCDPNRPTWYLDLGNETWEAVEISAAGWKIVTDPPVKFRRQAVMQALPIPQAGGQLDDLRHFVNLPDDDAWMLYRSWVLAAVKPTGPFPVLSLNGQHGSTKTTAAEIARKLFDPTVGLLSHTPKHVEDLWITANNNAVLGIDNLSHITDEVSDILCRIASGGSEQKRQLYTDVDSVTITVCRPIVLTGIEDATSRGDLIDRAVIITVPPLPPENRKTVSDFEADFAKQHPKILGGLLDAIVAGLRILPDVEIDKLPRMADFAKWGEATARGLGVEAGVWLATYNDAQSGAAVASLDSSPFIAALIKYMRTNRQRMTVTAAELKDRLEAVERCKIPTKGWPATPKGAGGILRRHVVGLANIGLSIAAPVPGDRVGNNRRSEWVIAWDGSPEPESTRRTAAGS